MSKPSDDRDTTKMFTMFHFSEMGFGIFCFSFFKFFRIEFFSPKNCNADLFLMLTSYKEDITILFGGVRSIRKPCFDFFRYGERGDG